MKLKILVLAIGMLWCINSARAQVVPVGLLDNTDDYLRRKQLLGTDSSGTSFMIRPMVSDSSLIKNLWRNSNGSISLSALPVVWQQQYNTNRPYGMNDGAMIPARGYQTLFSAGFAAKIGPLSIQLRPEVVYSENKSFKQFFDLKNTVYTRELYRLYYNSIDLPERLGNYNYTKFNWGQSSIKLNAGPVSFGLSNENLWWGPGVRNSLLMSNNASGFEHLTLNTNRPIRTPLGSFEAQIIGGKLDPSNAPLPKFTNIGIKNSDWRYLSGIVITYQPKWIPGLSLGLDRTFIVYSKQMGNRFADYFPIFSGLTKDNFSLPGGGKDAEDLKARDQLISFFARFVMPENKAEIYLQYGREDHSKDLRDGFVEPEHTRAYIFGFRKLIDLDREDEFIQLGIELTKLDGGNSTQLRGSSYWYTHSDVTSGYTQEGQILGAGIGPGSNLQSFDISWINGWNKLGFQVERFFHNNTLYNRVLSEMKDESKPWVDLGLSVKYDKEYRGFIFNSKLTYINSKRYQWALPEYGGAPGDNLQLRVGIMYRW